MKEASWNLWPIPAGYESVSYWVKQDGVVAPFSARNIAID
jgi:hypothetical protein